MGADLEPLIARYEALLALAERERRLLAEERYDDLATLAAQRDELVAGLPELPPEEARHLLERAAALQALTTRELEEIAYATALELRRVQRGLPALRRYAPPAEPGALDASA